MTQDRVDEIIHKFRSSASVDKIESLAEERKVRIYCLGVNLVLIVFLKHDVQFSQIQLFLQSLLTILKLKVWFPTHVRNVANNC